IETGARPVDATQRVANVDGTEFVALRTGRRNERRLFPTIFLQVFQSLSPQHGREIDDVVHRYVRARIGSGFAWDRLSGCCLFIGDVGLRNLRFRHRPYRLTIGAIENVEPTLFRRLCYELSWCSV